MGVVVEDARSNLENAAAPVDTSPPTAINRSLARWAWVIADGARTPYFILVSLFVFSAYFTTMVVGDPVRGQVLWSQVSTLAAIALAIGAPLLGAIADAGGRLKRWIAICTLIALPGMVGLAFATPHMGAGIYWIMLALLTTAIGLEFAPIFQNSLLPIVAKPSEIGTMSGLGMAVSNVLNFSALLFFLIAWSWNPHPLFGLSLAAGEPQRAVGPLAAAVLLLFSLPFFFFTPDAPPTKTTVRQAIARAFESILGTVDKLHRYPEAAKYMGARMIYAEGFIVLTIFTGVYAAGIMHWSVTTIAIQGLINSACAMVGGLIAARLDRQIRAKLSLIITIVGCLIANITLCLVSADSVFFIHVTPSDPLGAPFSSLADKVFCIAQGSIALLTSLGVAASRTLTVRLSPKEMLSEFFGLFGLTGTATSFLGPLSIGVVTSLFHSQQAGLSVGIVFLVAGLICMLFVNEPKIETA
jgi:UMF1 family MFS transporter